MVGPRTTAAVGLLARVRSAEQGQPGCGQVAGTGVEEGGEDRAHDGPCRGHDRGPMVWAACCDFRQD